MRRRRCLSPRERLDNANYLLSLLSNQQSHIVDHTTTMTSIDRCQLIDALMSLVHTDGVSIHQPTDIDQQVYISLYYMYVGYLDSKCRKKYATNGATM